MSYMLPSYCCQCILAEARDVLFLSFHPIEPNSIWFLWWGQTSTKDEAKVLKLNLTFPRFLYVCRDEKAGQPLDCLHDYVSPCFWIYITEQTSFQLPCYVPDSPSQKVNLIQAKKHSKLSRQCFEMVTVLEKYIPECKFKKKICKEEWGGKEVCGYIHLFLRAPLEILAYFFYLERQELFSIEV